MAMKSSRKSEKNLILMCEPRYYGIFYEINPWMKKKRRVKKSLAYQQWQNLYHTLTKKCGARIALVPPVKGWPDMVFTANAGLVYKHKVFLSNFKYPERQGESLYFRLWFKENGYQICGEGKKDYKFEGEGDGLFAGKTLFAGYGFRTDKKYFSRIKKDSSIKKIVYCKLVDPYFYHLDTCFCPLNDKQALWWPKAFSKAAQRNMEKQIELFSVPYHEAKHFACNSVVLDDYVVIPSKCPKTQKMLEELGFIVYDCNMTEYIKAGGACKCLTLKLK